MNQPSILVIDDQPYNFDVIEALLPNQLYELHYASSGQDAIDFLDVFKPDVILLDLMMPELDGMAVCGRIKAMPQWQRVPIIIVTALNSKEDLAQCLKAGANDFISKPINSIELRARVDSMLRSKKQYDALETALERQAVLEAEKIELLKNRTTELEQEVLKRTAALKATLEREQLVTKISSGIRASLNLQEILETTIQEVRSLLNCSRVAIWQFQPDQSAVIVAESISIGHNSYLGQQIYDSCFANWRYTANVVNRSQIASTALCLLPD